MIARSSGGGGKLEPARQGKAKAKAALQDEKAVEGELQALCNLRAKVSNDLFLQFFMK